MAAAAACALAGCAGTQPSGPAARPDYASPPMPAGASVAASPTGTAPARDCGDPTASLRPFPEGTTPPVASLARIQARGRLVVGLDTGSNLFSFRDPGTGTIEGFDADIAREVARDLLGDPNRVEFRILSSADRIPALNDNTVDIVVKTMTINCERREQVAFSTVYFLAQQRVLAAKGSGIRGAADLAGKRVCAAAGTTSVDHMQRVQPAATIVTVPNWADCLVVLQQRQVDAVTTDDALLAGLASQDPNLQIVGESLSPEPYGIGVNKADPDLVRLVNGSLDRIRRDGTWLRLYDRWLGMLGPPTGPPAPHYQD
ncbi:glutamate ABC transporter substrate-binding protein [Rhodococcus spelaei]|uniref:Glutamate ABC transporter substrate-binding protein n=1 Tax=Rhodococcus spelaei TaxID=2546320 RepID=A0A541BAH7_9NOCA|nr:glutamate ABC transporter substrate-binding protein [Rhodococcus spelaei]TQF69341.1 glutamate ABC transporter substrate-binding protein [Rhodococcus spelaei]